MAKTLKKTEAAPTRTATHTAEFRDGAWRLRERATLNARNSHPMQTAVEQAALSAATVALDALIGGDLAGVGALAGDGRPVEVTVTISIPEPAEVE